MGDPPARDGRGADDQAGVLVEPVQPDEQQVGQPLRQGVGAELGGLDQLLGEERVALGARHDAAQRAVGQRRRVQHLHQVADVVVGQPAEVDAASRPAAGTTRRRWCAAGAGGAGRRCGRTRPRTTGASKRRENRKLSISRVDWSAQCTSSTRSSSGAARPSSSSAAWTAAKSPGRSIWPSSATAGAASAARSAPVCSGSTRRAGISRAMAGAASTRDRARVGDSVARRPKASLNGRYGRAPSPKSRQCPTRTRWPASSAYRRSSASSRVLPTPASPESRTAFSGPDSPSPDGWDKPTRPASRSSSAARPTSGPPISVIGGTGTIIPVTTDSACGLSAALTVMLGSSCLGQLSDDPRGCRTHAAYQSMAGASAPLGRRWKQLLGTGLAVVAEGSGDPLPAVVVLDTCEGTDDRAHGDSSVSGAGSC